MRDANITTNGALSDYTAPTGVVIDARDLTVIYADGGGIAFLFGQGVNSANNIAIGINFAINDINSSVEAFTDSSIVQSLSGNIQTTALFDAAISAISIGGAGAVTLGEVGVH